MKKLTYLFLALLIFACSDDNEESTELNTNLSEKLISIFEGRSIDCTDGQPNNESGVFVGGRMEYNYSNNLISNFKVFDCEYDCYNILSCSLNPLGEALIEGYLTYYQNFPITNEISGYNVSYFENNVISMEPTGGFPISLYYTWENGNMISITTYIDGELHNRTEFNYSNLINKTGLFPPMQYGEIGFTVYPNPISMYGGFGNTTSMLPSSIVYTSWNENTGDMEGISTTEINYTLDEEGYVTNFTFEHGVNSSDVSYTNFFIEYE